MFLKWFPRSGSWLGLCGVLLCFFWGERLVRLQPEPGRWLRLLRREQGSWRVGVERGMWKGTRLRVGTAGGVPKVVLAGTCTLLVWGRRGGSRPGHPPGVFSRIFPPRAQTLPSRGVPVVLCGVVLARDGAAGVVSRHGRTDGRTDVLLLSLSFACQPCGCLPAPDPSRGCSPLPGLPLRAPARSKRPRCPRLSPALPEPRSPSRWCGVCVMGGSRMVSRAGCLDPECFRM